MAATFRLGDRHTIRSLEVHGAIYGDDKSAFGPKVVARWERWEGAGTVDSQYPKDGERPRDDYELALGFLGDMEASWGTFHRGTEECAVLSGSDLDARLIRAFGMLLLELADKVEAENEAGAAAEREHDRTMRRKLRRA